MSRVSAATLAIAASALVSCRSSDVSWPYSGNRVRFDVLATTDAVTCSPADLPAPANTSAATYVRLPAAGERVARPLDMYRDGDSVFFVPVDSSGREQTALTLRGIAPGSWSITTYAAAPIVEGARDGGYTFTVIETTRDSTAITPLVLLPPSEGVQLDLASELTTTFVFRTGGASGPVFTTCVATSSGSATSFANRY